MRSPVAHFPPILFLFLPIFPLSICYKILVISPATSASHLILNGRLADSLAKDGHNVVCFGIFSRDSHFHKTLLELEFINPLGKFNASKLAKTTRIHGPFVPAGQISILRRKLVERAFQDPSLISNLLHHRAFQNLLINACEGGKMRFELIRIFRTELIKTRKYELEELKKEHFEVVISEQITFCGSGLSHLLGVPIHILLNSGPMHESVASIIGLPLPSSWVPSASIASEHSDKMSLADRFVSFCRSILLKIWFAYNGIEIDELTRIFRKHFGPQFPDIIQIARESPLILVNTDEFVDFPRPTFPNIVNIGGLGIGAEGAKELEDPFKGEMEKGGKGVVYFSMGSVLPTLDFDGRFKRNIFQAFSQLGEYHFIVKIDTEDLESRELASKHGNIFVTNWTPQSQLLQHPRLRLFISHGGYNSVMEAARAGIPLLGMGFFLDQYRNARVAERNGWGLAFDKRLLLAENGAEYFVTAIQKVVSNPKYSLAAKRTQKLILIKPFSAEECLQKNIRFLDLNGGKLPELLAESRNMNAIALHNLDLLFLSAFIAIFCCLMIIFLTKRCLKTLSSNIKQRRITKEKKS